PNEPTPIRGRPGFTRVLHKQSMNAAIADSAPFQEIMLEVNEPRYSHKGDMFPALNYDRSPIFMGTADRASPDFNSHAMWNAHPQQGMIEVRIPWGLLLFTDPSSLQAFAGTDAKWVPFSRTSTGISLAAFAVRLSAGGGTSATRALGSSLPPVQEGK